jgi:hypothetical protein
MMYVHQITCEADAGAVMTLAAANLRTKAMTEFARYPSLADTAVDHLGRRFRHR